MVNKTVYSNDPIAVANSRQQNWYNITAGSNPAAAGPPLGIPTAISCGYVSGSQYICDITADVFTSPDGMGGYYWKAGTGCTGCFSINVFKAYSATSCGSGAVLIPGLGCTQTSSSSTPTIRDVPGTTSTCETPAPLNANASAGASSIPYSSSITNPKTCNPIDLMTGAKVDVSNDLSSIIPFSRNYSSVRLDPTSSMGLGWRHMYDKRLQTYTVADPTGAVYIATIIIQQENDEQVIFSRANATDPFTPKFADQGKYKLAVVSGNYVMTAPNNTKETYDSSSFRLLSIEQVGGYSLTMGYNLSGQLDSVTDSYARTLTFTYTGAHLTRATSSSGDYVDYTYDTVNNTLLTKSLNGARTITYTYDSNNNLNTKSTATGQPYGVYTYDSSHRATQSKHSLVVGMSAVDQDINQVTYNPTTTVLVQGSSGGIGLTTKTYNKTRLANFETKSGSVTYTQGSNTFTQLTPSYTSTGQLGVLTSYTDMYGISNVYTYPSSTDPYLSQYKRNANVTVNYTWDKPNNLLLSAQHISTNANFTIDYTYDANKNLTKKKYTTTSSGNREWNYTYTTFGKISTVTEPNAAVTTYSYYSDTDINPNNRSQVYQVTNSLSQVITVDSYDARGNPTQITMPNSLVKTYTYNDLSQVLTDTTTNSLSQAITTTYTYDANGSLLSVTKPGGEVINMEYDNLMRLIRVYNNLNDETLLSYDENGNLINSQTNKTTTLVGAVNAQFDALNRQRQLWKNNSTQKYITNYNNTNKMNPQNNVDPNSNTQSYTFTYGNLTAVSGWGENQTWTNNELFNPTNTAVGDTFNKYNYTYNDFEEVLTLNDFNTGNKSFAYDIANNKVTTTDASSTTHVNQMDSLGRTTSVVSTNGGTVLTDTFVYDNDGTMNTYALGQLTQANNADVNVSLVYGPWGLPSTYTQTLVASSDTKSISYTYNSTGQLDTMTLPSGLTINYSYDKGTIKDITTSSLITSNILKDTIYYPFSSIVQSFSWDYNANSNTYARTFNADGRISAINSILNSVDILNYSYTYDGADNVLTQVDSVLSKTNTYTYNLNKIATATDGTKSFAFSYGAKNVRTLKTETGVPNVSFTYNNASTNSSDKIITTTTTGSPARTYVYDPRGNVTSLGSSQISLAYDIKNRTISTTNTAPLTTTYLNNALNQRAYKSNTSGSTHYIYDAMTQKLVGEYEIGGSNYVEYIYNGDMLVAINKNGTLYYVHTDHLNTPRKVTDSTDAVVFDWRNVDPFGANNPTTNTISFNLRFPGQYFDNETNFYYNLNRYYNPSTGRYLQADPIGLEGGQNVYNYVANNPLNGIDPRGLDCRSNLGTTTCTHPMSGYTVSFPTPEGWIDSINQYGKSNSKYHAYDIQIDSSCYNDEDVREAIRNRPTPGVSNRSNRLGSANNATPVVTFREDSLAYLGSKAYPTNMVTSYTLADGSVLNVTQSTHSLNSGYVHRVVKNGVIHNYGEGNGILQSNSMQRELPIIPSTINGQWYAQSKNVLADIINKSNCSCKK